MPYYLRKRLEISGAHRLSLDYESPCTRLHGHNWVFTVFCRCEDDALDENGMVIDFKAIKTLVTDKLDHRLLNEVVDFNPTAENLAKWVCDLVPHCYRVDVEESRNNTASYIKPGAADLAW